MADADASNLNESSATNLKHLHGSQGNIHHDIDEEKSDDERDSSDEDTTTNQHDSNVTLGNSA